MDTLKKWNWTFEASITKFMVIYLALNLGVKLTKMGKSMYIIMVADGNKIQCDTMVEGFNFESTKSGVQS